MKIDLSRLPVLEGLIGFFIVVLIITFAGAFAATGGDGDEGGEEPGAAATPAGTPAPDGSTVAVGLGDNFFDPDSYLVAAGATVTFEITNEGNTIHNMHIEDVVSDPDAIDGGASGTLQWTAPAEAGEVEFQCDFHPGMTGTVIVQ
jgi:plastocyanin